MVVIALNEGVHLRNTLDSLRATLPESAEILVVDDGSDDGSSDFLAGVDNSVRLVRSDHLGVAKARNWGATQTTGEVILFADAHISVAPGWWVPMVEVLREPSVGAVAPAISDMEQPECKGFGLRLTGPDLIGDWLDPQGPAPYQVPILPGCCLGMRRDTFEATGGFDNGMLRWGGVDNELGVRLWLLGYELWVIPQVEVVHLFREQPPYCLEWDTVLHNRLRLAFVHFSRRRIVGVIDALRDHEGFAGAMGLAAESDAAARRADLRSRRSHDDDWFFQRFGPGW